MDLATSLGYLGDLKQPAVQEAIATIEAKTLAAGKVLGTISASWEQAHGLYERGYQLVMVMADGVSLAKLAAAAVADFRAAYPDV